MSPFRLLYRFHARVNFWRARLSEMEMISRVTSENHVVFLNKASSKSSTTMVAEAVVAVTSADKQAIWLPWIIHG